MKALTTLLVIGMFLTTVAMADDVDDVKAALLSYFAALNAGDTDAYMQARLPEYSAFADGGLLNRSTSLEQQRNNFQPSNARRVNRSVRHLEVRVYGNTAVTTSYTVGTITNPDGTTSPINLQRTGVWIKQGGEWKEVHHHRSPLNVAPPQ